MYTLGQSSLTLTTDSNCKHSSETIKLETQASPIIFSEELKTMCKHQQDWQDSKPIPILSWPKIENHVLQKTEVERVPLHSLVALVKIESAESQIVTTNLVPSVKEEGIDPIKKFQDQRDNVATNEVLRFEFDQQAFAAFLNGLSGEIGRFIRLTDPKTSKDAIRAAINVIERDRRPQVTHRPGILHGNADALSRKIRALTTGVNNELKTAQELDEDSSSWKTQDDFVEGEGIFYGKTNQGLRIVVPKALVKEVLEECHVAVFSGHAGKCSTNRKVVERATGSVMINARMEITQTCLQKCVVQEGLMKHMVRHSGERKFVCDLCGKRFMHRFDLSKHKKSSIHNGKNSPVAGLPYSPAQLFQSHTLNSRLPIQDCHLKPEIIIDDAVTAKLNLGTQDGTMRWRERRPQHSRWRGEVERKETSALNMARILDEIGQTKLPRSETEPGAFHRGIPHSPMVRLNQ
uniref:C2H2-type domain-containing protein n=1 Tax=Timema tahoe TaxID=61484 RepID=A0A7R9IP15_9NEOP|nr:unnamed protein product [Timema tahoe]